MSYLLILTTYTVWGQLASGCPRTLEVCLQIFEDKKLTGQLPYILIFYMYMQGRRRRNIGETFTGFPGNFAKRVERVAAIGRQRKGC